MSTITAEMYRPVAVAPRTRLRMTQRGRRVLAWLVALPVIVALVIAGFSGGAALASREESAPAGTFETVTVAPGDTLWSIAQEIAPAADPRDVIDEILSLNALADGGVQAGQQIAIPAQYSQAG